MTKCNLELNEEQTDIVLKALELYTRMGTGQVSALLTHPSFENLEEKEHFEANDALFQMKKTVFPQLKGSGDSMSLHNERVVMEAKNAYDIMQVVKHQFAIADKASEHSVWRFEPRRAGNLDFPVCKLN